MKVNWCHCEGGINKLEIGIAILFKSGYNSPISFMYKGIND